MRVPVDSCWKRIGFFVMLWAIMVTFADGLALAEEQPVQPCASPEFRQFDFWIGDWEVFDFGTTNRVARAEIDSILGTCVLKEVYRATDGHEGQSFSTFDTSRGLWHQTWVTDHGVLLSIEGKFVNGEMVLSGNNQQGVMVRGTWKPVDGGVREIGVKSSDAGKTWEPWFDIIFRRLPGGEGERDRLREGGSDKEIVAALDNEYQAAVKRNDAGAMGRILSDDFILVTSSGKLYTKPQLLEEAQSARRIYEHQEDSDKTIRLWGDTAIVTAKLWEKGTENGKPFEHWLWFSDVYRRTSSGWRYVFAQSAYRPDQNLP
jgi:ketosteroid isomerase-like protein